jgi:hypothetical protein
VSTDLAKPHVRSNSISADTPYGCHNRKPYLPVVQLQVGWIDFQTPKIEPRPFFGSLDCKYDLMETDLRCKGCSWIKPAQAARAEEIYSPYNS